MVEDSLKAAGEMFLHGVRETKGDEEQEDSLQRLVERDQSIGKRLEKAFHGQDLEWRYRL